MVMDLISIIISAYVIGFFASTAATGPVNFLVFQNALVGRYGNSVMLILGSTIMETVYCSFAVITVGAVYKFSYHGVQFLSEIVGVIILFIVGFFIFKTEPSEKPAVGVEGLSTKEKTRDFLTGFILVALNPTVILTWSAAVASLISFGILEISGILDVFTFTLSASLGTLSGSLTMVFFVNLYRLSFSKKFIKIFLRIMALIVWGIALFFLIKILEIF
jgi:threonine/homoserine/homoserine lactone efflux protein